MRLTHNSATEHCDARSETRHLNEAELISAGSDTELAEGVATRAEYRTGAQNALRVHTFVSALSNQVGKQQALHAALTV